MNTGILDCSLEVLGGALLLPEGMTITDATLDAPNNALRIFVQHEDIPAVGPGDWLPLIDVQYEQHQIKHVTLKSWRAVEGYPPQLQEG